VFLGPVIRTDWQAISRLSTLTKAAMAGQSTKAWWEEEEEEERGLIVDLKRHTQLAVAWNRHGSLVPRWT